MTVTSSVVSIDNHSTVPGGSFSTETSPATLAVPPTHRDEHSLDSVMRRSQVENASKEKNVHENSTDKSQTMTSAEVSLKKKRRKKTQAEGHDAIKSNDNLSALPKDAFSTETSMAALAVSPTHSDEHSLDSVMRQSQDENASKEKNVCENSTDKCQTMISAEVSLKKKRRKKRRVEGHDAIKSNDNLAAVSKDAFPTETSAAALAVPPTHPDEHSLDSVMRQSQDENASKEKNVRENSTDKCQTMISAEVSLKKKRRKKRLVEEHNAIKSNDNLSAVSKDAFSTETSAAALAVPPTHSDEHSLDSVMRQSQDENASKEKNVRENSTDKSQTMTGAEVSLKKKRRKKRRAEGHDAIKSNDNLSAVPKDAFSTETSMAALAVSPTHSDEHSLDSVMRQCQDENASKEKNVHEISTSKSQTMTSAEVSLKKKRRRKKRQAEGHDAIKSKDNLSAVPKEAFSTETSSTPLAVPPTLPDEHSLDSSMRQAEAENASKEENVIENASDGSQIMTSAEVCLGKKRRKKRQEEGHDAIKSNDNLSAVPKDAFSTETSTAALAVPPEHPAEQYVGSVMRQSQVENALNEKNVLENASDKSQTMTSGEVSLKKKRRKKRQEEGHDAIKSNNNISAIPKDAFSTETSTAALAVPLEHPDEQSLDSVMRQSQVENVLNEKNVLENASDKSQITISVEVSSRKKRKRKKWQEKGLDASESNDNLSAVPKDTVSVETSTAVMVMPRTHPFQPSVDPLRRQFLAENEVRENCVLQHATDGYLAMMNIDVNSSKKGKKQKRKKARHDCIETNVNHFGVLKDNTSLDTSTRTLVLPPLHSGQYPMGPVMRLSQEANEEVQNMIAKPTDGSTAMANEEVSSKKKNKKRKRRKAGCNNIECDTNHSEVPKDTFSPETCTPTLDVPSQFPALDPVMSQCQEENQGKELNMVEKATDGSPAMTSVEGKSRKKNKGRMRKETRHDSLQSNTNLCGVSEVDISHSTLVSKHDCSNVSRFPLGRAISSYSKRKLLVLDLNGLLADFVLGVPKGFKRDTKIHNKSVFKRPFCDDFLQFCFDKFHVGIWSSRKRQNVDAAIKLLVGVSASKLLFAWDQRHCTMTTFQTIEDRNKPLMLKELRKLWEKCRRDLPWEKGEFNETNTLLLDDSPYKAILNPMHTAVFPYSYQYSDTNDTSLGPGGDLRVYLEGLAMAENVQEYVASHPFGQPPITESSPHWDFYCLVRDQSLQRRGRL
ncbi:leashin-like [Prosopis cineraria]|uniref:leashin-like n=1 Tax=Prosopis cineraria TaxID=364024 RepID=UPI00240EBBF9|nr:leashin-like [Prosopis cineraria]